jgi:hypothetical protein
MEKEHIMQQIDYFKAVLYSNYGNCISRCQISLGLVLEIESLPATNEACRPLPCYCQDFLMNCMRVYLCVCACFRERQTDDRYTRFRFSLLCICI